jgi:DNA topoisomerase-3
MEETAIAEGLRSLRPGADYDSLYHSALCRQQADWLVGMNYSRLFSVLYNAQLRVGRVQTPTLAMIVEREQKIGGFVKEPFYTVELSGGGFTAEREKVKDKAVAEAIRADCDGRTAVIKSVQRQEKSTAPPKLYDLTTLQREANRLFGYTASQTLSCVQNLYELKVTTYPRTDSRFVTEDMAAGIPPLVMDIAEFLPFDVGTLSINPAQVANNDKVTDHHAIIPTITLTKTDISNLPTADRNILMMICARLVSAVSDRHIYAETAVTVECNGETFTAKGRTVIQNGWKTVEQAYLDTLKKTKKDDDKALPDLYEGQQFTADSSVREGFSQPPKHFTEDLLLSAMETAGAEDMPDDAERKGLGTPATRASIIENLVKSGLLERKDKQLLPTAKGVNLIKILPDSVKSPMLTAEWENHFKRIERGEMSANDFMIAINRFVADTVKTYNTASEENKALFPSNRPSGELVGKCPRCTANVTEAPKGWFCDNKACKFGLFKENKFFTSQKKKLTKEIVKTLLAEGRIFISGFTSAKTGKPYDATVVLDDKGDGYPGFTMEFEKKGGQK